MTLEPHKEMTWTLYFVWDDTWTHKEMLWTLYFNCNRCFGGRPVGTENVMGNKRFVLDIKFYEIIVFDVVFIANMCDVRM